MSEVRMAGEKLLPTQRKITERGSGESLGSLQRHAETHTDWRDGFREGLGAFRLAPKVGDIDWSTREIDSDGRVKVNATDAIYGVSQPELQAEYESWRRGELNNSTAGNEYESLFKKKPVGDEGLWKPTRINETDVSSKVTTEKTRIADVKEAMDTLSGLEVNAEGAGKKAEILRDLRSKRNVSAQEVSNAYQSLLKYNPETISDRAQGAANLAQTQQQTASSQVADEVSKGTLTLNTQKAEAERLLAERRLNLESTAETNRNAIALSEIDYKNLVAANTFKNEQMRLQYENERAAADLDLRRDLAVLGLEGQAEDRRYNSERDRAQDKQMFILQLMKGLGSLGQGFSL